METDPEKILIKGSYLPAEVGVLLDTDNFGVYRLVKSGRLDAVRVNGKHMRINRSAILKYLRDTGLEIVAPHVPNGGPAR
jgi:excisionase family DNA binding protein